MAFLIDGDVQFAPHFTPIDFERKDNFFMGADSPELRAPSLGLAQQVKAISTMYLEGLDFLLAQHKEHQTLGKFNLTPTPEKMLVLRMANDEKRVHKKCQQNYSEPQYIQDVAMRGQSFATFTKRFSALQNIINDEQPFNETTAHAVSAADAMHAENLYLRQYEDVFGSIPDYIVGNNHSDVCTWQAYQIGLLKLVAIRDGQNIGRQNYNDMAGFLNAFVDYKKWDSRHVTKAQVDFWQDPLDEFLAGSLVYAPRPRY